MAGIIDHGDVGIAGAVGEVAQRALGLGRRKVTAGIDDVEAGALQRLGDFRAVVNRIGQRRDILIGGIAEHQRHALLGKGRLVRQQQRGSGKDQSIHFYRSRFHHDTTGASHNLAHRPWYQKPLPGFVSWVTNPIMAHARIILISRAKAPSVRPLPITIPAQVPRYALHAQPPIAR